MLTDLPLAVFEEVLSYSHWIHRIPLSFVCKSWSDIVTPASSGQRHLHPRWLSIHAAACGIDIMRWLVTEMGVPISLGTFRSAIACNDDRAVRYLHSHFGENVLKKECARLAAHYGHCKWLRRSVAQGHDEEVLQFMEANEWTIHLHSLSAAAAHLGRIDVLETIDERHINNEKVISEADEGRQMEVLRWFHSKGIVYDVCKMGNWAELEDLMWAAEAGYLNEETLLSSIIEGGNVEALKWLVGTQDPQWLLTHATFRLAVKHGRVEMMDYLASIGCNIANAHTEAIRNRQLPALKWLISKDSRMDPRDIWMAAAYNADVPTMEFLDHIYPVRSLASSNIETSQLLHPSYPSPLESLMWLRSRLNGAWECHLDEGHLDMDIIRINKFVWAIRNGMKFDSSLTEYLHKLLEHKTSQLEIDIISSRCDGEEELMEGSLDLTLADELCEWFERRQKTKKRGFLSRIIRAGKKFIR
ncbi:hypothetical protein PROFUN_11860 [Planoprotostelium fungivorum]|uniref:F-box domain-containing protein n=1 Tax=Planoprotostelium fungivorum TaxID=1890364 RepID=A0A2P6N9B6_9EUKA|nr:hypothetical protein PROFUN_11860 [Planoprotostelium fungivorum]